MASDDDLLPVDVLQEHPPERGRRRKQYVILYSCCCCCCCCLHSVGGAIGAAVAGVQGNYRAEELGQGKSATQMPSSQGIYWFSVFLSLLLAWIVVLLFWVFQPNAVSPTGRQALFAPLLSLYVIGVSLILVGPAWLLAGSIVMAVRLAFSKKLRGHTGYWKSLGWITLGGVVGSAIGLGLMFGLFVLVTGVNW